MSPNTDDLGAIDVAALMTKVRLEVPRDTVTVQGIVAELRIWSKDLTIAFGELRGFDGSTMSFKCPVSAGLAKEDYAVLRGTLNAYKSKKHRGFDLLLEGTRVGAWTPSEPPAVQRPLLERTEPKRTLQRYLSGKSIQSLALIGTEVGIRDAKQALLGADKVGGDRRRESKLEPSQFGLERISSTTLDGMLPVIADVAEKYDGLCLVRGGGDVSSFSTWNDGRLIEALILSGKPFYTALGHTHDVTLADVYADESFGTPSMLGAACKDAWQARFEQEEQDKRLRYLKLENERLKTANEGASRTELDRKMLQLQTSLDEFQKLPGVLGKQMGQAVSLAVKASLQDHLRQPVSEALQGPIANLRHATDHARSVLVEALQKARFHAWAWLFSVFLLGVLAGAFGLYSLERSAPFVTRHEAAGPQESLPATTKPSELKPGSGTRRH